MTVNGLINKYGITLHPDGDKIQIPGGKRLTKTELEPIISAKPEIIAELKARREAEAQREAEAKAKLIANVPGLDILRDALTRQEMYQVAFNRMMEDEGNDGARPPKKPTDDIATLKAQYPAAAAYLKAESWEYAGHYAKSAAGRKAKQAIADGADYTAVLAQMEAEWSAHCAEHAWD
jgi:hypothetical protein